ncbi:MAG: succinyldiaminopimelate transaminase [Actinomycetaceae bacterium]|nr:succinyldiaminopimelate transaminase [Actinomycetaceae bacterium]
MTFYAERLPDFPWDSLTPIRQRAAEHPQGVCDLTIGSPVDSVPVGVQEALMLGSDAHGYPPTVGTAELREAIVDFVERERGVTGNVGIIPALGSKEMVALLPSFLGLGEGAIVAFPAIAYPTYDVGARLAGCEPMLLDTESDPAGWDSDISLLWLNSPSNPHGHVLSVEQLRRIVAWARENDVIVASDECYAPLCWGVDEAPSLLDKRVCGGDTRGLLMLYSVSKQSNMAGYRASFLAGDTELIAGITELRKHCGFMMPSFVQHAMAVALGDSEHVDAQREVYARRREVLLDAVERAGLVNDDDRVAGLYLWVRAPEALGVSGWDIVRACAELGVIVTPGDFYGEAGRDFVRMSLTATDEAISAAAARLPALSALLEANA